jgi:predicted ATPase/transcriptional regulator with XRE-family HTH domain/Tfp pilus assembly protein PilF
VQSEINNQTSFGKWLKSRRKDLDLTQEALAGKIGYSAETIKKVEGGTLRPSRQLAERLAFHLEIPAEEQADFVQWARNNRTDKPINESPTALPPTNTPTRAVTNLPIPPTPLIGRRHEISEAIKLLNQPEIRLLTFTGTGGTGKTRLAIQTAREATAFDDGVFFVPLASIFEPDLVIPTIAAAFDLKKEADKTLLQSLKEYLHAKNMLLVLDNFEQIVSAAPYLSELLAATTHLKILVTSRAGLRLRGEREFPVPPLNLPETAALPPLPELAQYEAIKLFVERANAVKPNFALTPENAEAITAICRRLDGLPLAIELVAPQIKLLPPLTLLERMNSRLTLTTKGAQDLPDRQRTLRDTIAWSYDLLASPEQILFRRLGIFVGGWTIEILETLTNHLENNTVSDVLEGLSELINSNLVKQTEETNGTPRFYLLETIREFAHAQLIQTNELNQVHSAHLQVFLELAKTADKILTEGYSEVWLARLETEQDNFRSALEWSLNNSAPTGLKLAVALTSFWLLKENIAEARNWLEQILAKNEPPSGCHSERSEESNQPNTTPNHPNQTESLDNDGFKSLTYTAALGSLGSVTSYQGEYTASRSYFERSLALYEELNNLPGIARIQSFLGDIHLQQGDLEQSRRLLEQAVSDENIFPSPNQLAWTFYNLGTLNSRQGRFEAAQACFEKATGLAKMTGNDHNISDMLLGLAHAALLRNDYAEAERIAQESLNLNRKLNNRRQIENTLNLLGYNAYRAGNFEQAKKGFQENLKIAREIGDPIKIGWASNHLADVYRWHGDYEEASKLYQESLALFRAREARQGIASILHNMGYLAAGQGNLVQAETHFRESLQLFVELGYTWSVADALMGIGRVYSLKNQPEIAARLLGASEVLHQTIDPSMALLDTANRVEREQAIETIRAVLPEADYNRFWQEGRAMSMEQAVAYAQTLP